MMRVETLATTRAMIKATKYAVFGFFTIARIQIQLFRLPGR